MKVSFTSAQAFLEILIMVYRVEVEAHYISTYSISTATANKLNGGGRVGISQ
jgi:hypothetical protein